MPSLSHKQVGPVLRPAPNSLACAPSQHCTSVRTKLALRNVCSSKLQPHKRTTTPDQPIPTQTNGNTAFRISSEPQICVTYTGKLFKWDAGLVQTVVAAATSVLRLGQLG